MRTLKGFFARTLNFVTGRQGDARLRQEMEQQLAMQTDENIRAGMSFAEARRQARLQFGGVEVIRRSFTRRGRCHSWKTCSAIHATLCVSCANRLALTLTAVLTLALSIGATTAIFTLVQQVMLQSLPVTRPDQLWRIGDQPHCCNWAGYSQDGDGEPNDWNLFPW